MNLKERIQDIFHQYSVQLELADNDKKEDEVQMAKKTLANGTVIYTDAEDFAVGVSVFIVNEEGERMPLPDGEYEYEGGGKTVVAGGKIAEMVEAEEEKKEEEKELDHTPDHKKDEEEKMEENKRALKKMQKRLRDEEPQVTTHHEIFYALRVPPRQRSRKFSRKFSKKWSKKVILQNFRTRRTLGDVANYMLSKFQPSATLAGTTKIQKTKKKTFFFFPDHF